MTDKLTGTNLGLGAEGGNDLLLVTESDDNEDDGDDDIRQQFSRRCLRFRSASRRFLRSWRRSGPTKCPFCWNLKHQAELRSLITTSPTSCRPVCPSLPLPASRITYDFTQLLLVVCLDVCLRTYFSNRYSSYSFSPSLTKLCTYVLCGNVHKNMEQIFGNFAFKISGKIYFFCQQWNSLGLV